MPYTTDAHRRNCRQIDILLGQRPSRNSNRNVSPRPQNIEKHIKRLMIVQSALKADQQTFHIFCLPHEFFNRFSKAGTKKVEAIKHVRWFQPAKDTALKRIDEDLMFLRSQI